MVNFNDIDQNRHFDPQKPVKITILGGPGGVRTGPGHVHKGVTIKTAF